MGKVIADMTTSLDGFGRRHTNGSADRLYTDLGELHDTEYMRATIEETLRP